MSFGLSLRPASTRPLRSRGTPTTRAPTPSGAAIARVLEPRESPDIQDHPGNQLDRRLRRRRDDDLTRLGPDAPVLDEMARQGLLQRRAVVCAAAPLGAARGAAQASTPDVMRKRPRVGQAGNERASRGLAGKP